MLLQGTSSTFIPTRPEGPRTRTVSILIEFQAGEVTLQDNTITAVTPLVDQP